MQKIKIDLGDFGYFDVTYEVDIDTIDVKKIEREKTHEHTYVSCEFEDLPVFMRAEITEEILDHTEEVKRDHDFIDGPKLKPFNGRSRLYNNAVHECDEDIILQKNKINSCKKREKR